MINLVYGKLSFNLIEISVDEDIAETKPFSQISW